MAAWLAGCTQHRIQVDPIHITMDINLKIDRELDDFFAFEEDLLEDRKQPTDDDSVVDDKNTEKGDSQ